MTSTDRRRSAEIRPLLIRAATEEFATKGYAGATVTEIAQRAQVAPSVLYRHFPSKADVFKAAVISPLLEAIEDFRSEWSRQRSSPYPPEQMWLAFVNDLHRSFSRHRQGLSAFISAGDQLDPAVVADIQEAMSLLFREITAIAAEEAERRRVQVADVELLIRLVVTLVAGATTMGPLTLQLDDGPVDPGRLVNGMSALTMWGLAMTPPRRARSSVASRRESAG